MNEPGYRLTTNPGIEDIVETELREHILSIAPDAAITQKPHGLSGVVQLDPGNTDRKRLEAKLRTMRSIFHVIRDLETVVLSSPEHLDELIQRVEKTSFPGITAKDTFRVTSHRTGIHSFGSMDIARKAGAAVNRATGMAVDLENYSVHIRVDLVDNIGTIGIQLTEAGLDRRHIWAFRPRVALRTTVAYAMLRLADCSNPPRAIIDPFCGSATILLEAAELWPNTRMVGLDSASTCAAGASENVSAAGLRDRIEIHQADARDLTELYSTGSFDAVICNPPFGIRLGRKTDLDRLYRKFLHGVRHILVPGGRAVFLVGKRRHQITRMISEVPGLQLTQIRVIETGDVYPAIFVLEYNP